MQMSVQSKASNSKLASLSRPFESTPTNEQVTPKRIMDSNSFIQETYIPTG